MTTEKMSVVACAVCTFIAAACDEWIGVLSFRAIGIAESKGAWAKEKAARSALKKKFEEIMARRKK